MRFALLLCFVWLGMATTSAAQPTASNAQTTPRDPESTLPDEPTKGLVLAQCDICHDLAWIERSGGTEEGWTDRIRRMIRAGAQIPSEQIPLLAGYLAKALPERPRPSTEQGPSHRVKP